MSRAERVEGSLQVDDPLLSAKCFAAPQARGAAFKGFVIPSKGGLDKLLDRVDIGVSYATDTDDVYGSLRAKKSFAFGSGNVAGEVQVAGEVDVTMDKKVNNSLMPFLAVPHVTVDLRRIGCR